MKTLLIAAAFLCVANVTRAEYMADQASASVGGALYCEVPFELNPGERGVFDCLVAVRQGKGPGLLISGNDNVDGSVLAVERSIPQPRGQCFGTGICPSWLTTVRFSLSNRSSKFQNGNAVFLFNGDNIP